MKTSQAPVVRVNDTVRILGIDENHPNAFARVVEVHNNHVRVSNMNQPFQGTFAYAYFRHDQYEKV